MAKFKIIHTVTVKQLDLVDADSINDALEKIKHASTDPITVDVDVEITSAYPVDSFEPTVLELYPTIQPNYMDAFLKDVVIK